MDSPLDDLYGQRILIAPLNWGLGHAARCAPIINQLYAQDNEITIASDGLALDWLRLAYANLQNLPLPAYNMGYHNLPMWINMIRSAPRILAAIRKEQHLIRAFLADYPHDLIISDHRYGVYNDEIPSVIIAHQLSILHPNPLVGQLATRINLRYISRFDQCWIPDTAARRISGHLSDADLPITKRYLGVLSRFEPVNPVRNNCIILIVLSGPEPARSRFEAHIIKVISSISGYQYLLVRGTLRPLHVDLPPQVVEVIDLADDKDLLRLFVQARLVISRSGYSSLMDYERLGLPAILIPTPGQPEQEYLANRISYEDRYIQIAQDQCSPKTLVTAIERLSGS